MEQDSIPVGCIPSAAVAVGVGGLGVCPSACWDTCQGGVCPVHAGISAQGMSAPVHAGIHIPPPVDRILDTRL